MNLDMNKKNMRRAFDEVLNQDKYNVLDELVVPKIVNHQLKPPYTQDLAGFKKYLKDSRTTFPDLKYTVIDMIAEGDKLVVRWFAKGTQKGKFATMPDIEPTNKPVTFEGITVARCDENGKALEVWGEYDEFGILQQLGIIPIPA